MVHKERRAGFVLLTLIAVSCESGGSNEEELSTWSYDEPAPIICDVPTCSDRALTVRRPSSFPPLELREVSTAEARESVRKIFERREPEAIAIATLLDAAESGGESDSSINRIQDRLGQIVPDWRNLVGVLPRLDVPSVIEGQQALETSGCGEMSLVMKLDAVTVHEREDNFTHDLVYCIARAESTSTSGEASLEMVATEVSPALDTGQRYDFEDGTFFGREGGRDPGEELRITYDCWEHDSPEEYEKFETALSKLQRIAKLLPAQVQAYVAVGAKVAKVLIELGKAFDSDDHLFTANENVRRQALWSLMLEEPREVARRGTNNGSDWSWTLDVVADGCAGSRDSGGRPDSEPGAAQPAEPVCSPATCDGCCVGRDCLRGNTDGECGRSGEDCSSCDSHERCNGGQCSFDSSVRFDIEVLGAEISGTDQNGSAWDAFGGAPDPIVELACGGDSGGVAVQNDTYFPSWNDVVLQGVEARDLINGLSVEVTDDDAQFDESISSCRYSVSESELIGGDFSVQCDAYSVVYLRASAR